MTDRLRPQGDEPTATAWSARYDAADTPWDLGRASPLLAEVLSADPALGRPDGPGRALVPGCGRGHDAVALAVAGWDVVAVDIAPATEPIAGPALAEAGARFELGDALAHDDGPYDLVFDHTFFCALPLRLRPAFGALCHRVLGPDGVVASVIFPIDRAHDDGGPPFGMSVDDVSAALGEGFTSVVVGGTVELRERGWPHRWATWRRTEAGG